MPGADGLGSSAASVETALPSKRLRWWWLRLRRLPPERGCFRRAGLPASGGLLSTTLSLAFSPAAAGSPAEPTS
eukprot:2043495-Amphidinium_carterae.3